MVFDAPNPKKSPSIILSFQNYRPEFIVMCIKIKNFIKTMLFGQCHSTLSFCYENMSPNTSYFVGKYSLVKNLPVFCEKKKFKFFSFTFWLFINILHTLVFFKNVNSSSSKLFPILKRQCAKGKRLNMSFLLIFMFLTL